MDSGHYEGTLCVLWNNSGTPVHHVLETCAVVFSYFLRLRAINKMWVISLSRHHDTKVQEPSVDYCPSTTAIGNSTSLRSPITAANAASSLTTTNNIYSDCVASSDAWFSSYDLFYRSVSSARAAGRYSSRISIREYPVTIVDYSYLMFTPNDGIACTSTSFSTATSTTTYANTGTSLLEPIYTGSSVTCNALCIAYSNQCTISAESVQLHHWPGSYLSDYPNVTVTSNATEPVTAVVNGTTFTSPTVHLSYVGVSAVDYCSRTVGKSYTGAIIGVSLDAVLSIESPHSPATTFNFADLNKPYSPDVLYKICWPEPQERCVVADDAVYNPRIVVPEEIRALDPAWKNCEPDFFGSYDPPRILVPAQVLVNPTLAAEIKGTPSTATPAHTVKSQEAANTSKLDARKPSPSESPSAIIFIDQHPSVVGPSHPKPTLEITPAISSPIIEVPSNEPPGQNQNPLTKARDTLTTNPSDHSPTCPIHTGNKSTCQRPLYQ